VLTPLDWGLIGAYLSFSLGVAVVVRRTAGRGRLSYFAAERSLPWWWAGTSIAATTFAADTPLAITGIVAARGMSGNWIWLSWMVVHAAVIVVFARRWWRAGTITDAEFITLRYGRSPGATTLRTARAALYGLVYNAIILGWVLRAMEKILQPVVPWGSTATLVVLVGIVTLYASVGGLRGVVITDLVQFVIGAVGSVLLAVVALEAVGGRAGLQRGLERTLGDGVADLTRLAPDLTTGWASAVGAGAFGLGAYLLVQSFANVPADGGGYVQQRLVASRSEADAQRAAGLFFGLQYFARVWPWFIVAFAALVIFPVGGVPDGPLATMVASDRELAYPALIFTLLPPGAVGLLVVGLLAAFMSTIDTHLNWGASYVVNDLVPLVAPDLSPRVEMRVARLAVVGFGVLAVLVALQIETIEQAWRWVAVLGASLGMPTIVRWCWWRVTPVAELAAGATGLAVAALLGAVGSMPYERELIIIALASVVGMSVGVAWGPAPDVGAAATFVRRVAPPGLWPDRSRRTGWSELVRLAGGVATVVAVTVASLWLGTRWLLG
jgi:Na+/proline symporter